MTASVLRLVLRERGLSLDAPMGSAFKAALVRRSRILANISFRQLLEHSHGLDGSSVQELPRRLDGFLNEHALIGRLERVAALAAPGALCSYSELGAWLAGLAIEQATGQPFCMQLPRVLRPPVETRSAAVSTFEPICPAMGGGLSIRATTGLSFLVREMRPGVGGLLAGTDPAEVELHVRPRAGWSAVDRGVYLGWAYYGHGWFGHNSITPRSPMMVRVNPQSHVALMVATNGVNPTMAAGRLFARMAPKLFSINSPASIGERPGGDRLRSFEGLYATQRIAFQLQACDERTIRLIAYERAARNRPDKPFATATLVPGCDNVLISRTPHPRLPRFFQLIVPEPDGFHYLWDGESAFPRTAIRQQPQ